MLFFDILQMDASQLLQETTRFHQQERSATVQLLVRLAAVDTRELYSPAGYSTMWDYCLGELDMSDDAAHRRLWAARKCRDFPALFDALADGRLHLTAVNLLAAHLTLENVDELIEASANRTKDQIKEMLACKFPQPGVPTSFKPVGASASPDSSLFNHVSSDSQALAPTPVPTTPQEQSSSRVPLPPRTQIEPLNVEQVRVEFTMLKRVKDKLEHAMNLLGTRVPPKDVGRSARVTPGHEYPGVREGEVRGHRAAA